MATGHGLIVALTAAAAGHAGRTLRTQARFARAGWGLLAGSAGAAPRAWDPPSEQYNDLLRNYAVDMALDMSATARSLAHDLQPVERAADAPDARLVDGRLVTLPARIAEASQGSAVYAVPADGARALLRELAPPFEPLITATGAAMLTLFVVDYRRSDLGAYFELGAAIMGRPAGDPLAPPGMVVFALPVSGAFTRDCGRQVWGYPKSLAPDLTVRRTGAVVECRLSSAEAGFAMTLSRRGFGASHELPMTTYTVREGKPTRTVFTRSGRAERMRAGGRVALTLGGVGGGGCACGLAAADPTVGCLCARLRALGLPKAPVASGWTEEMSGAFGPPETLARV